MTEQIEFIQAESLSEISEARELFLEYSEWLGLDLCFQNFEQELAELPGRYALPQGRLLLAVSGKPSSLAINFLISPAAVSVTFNVIVGAIVAVIISISLYKF